MEVTRANFQEVLVELDQVLQDATFLAIDGEFTGLNSGPDASVFDTPAQYYAKLRTGSMDFLLVQLGLSVFTYNPDSKKYSQRSYNFYVFPRPFNRSTPDCRFMCQASSIAFLANQGFDFNKLFKHGIPYLTRDEEEKLNKKLEEKQKARDDDDFDLIPIPDNDKCKIEEICSRIDNFINSEDNELIIDRCNAFIRRLINQEVKLRWPNKLRLESKNENGNQFIIAFKVGSESEEKIKDAERKEREKFEVKEAVGVSALLRKVADSGKVIVGHNMLLDLCHMIHQFFGPLPESYKEFKSLVHCLFPKLLDTKIMCQSSQFKDLVPSILNHLLETLQHSPFEFPETEDVENRSYQLQSNKLHEAGYDAYITGLCFISLCNKLGSLQVPETPVVLADSPLLNPYLNKLLIARLKDYPHINLTGKDPNPSRDHVFHITFPKQWKLSNLTQIFSPYGGAYVNWLSDTTAYAGLYRREQANAVTKNLFKSTQYTIRKYADHQASLENDKTTKLERKRKISESESPFSTTDDPAKPAEQSTEVGKNVASPSRDEDGWEVASGRSRLKSAAHYNDDEVSVPASVPTAMSRGSPENFSLVRKTRPKVSCMPRPRHTRILRHLETDRNCNDNNSDKQAEEEGENKEEESPYLGSGVRNKFSQSNKRYSPKISGSGSSPYKRRQQHNQHHQHQQSKQQNNVTLPCCTVRNAKPTASSWPSYLTSWCTCLRIAQLAGVLVLLYFFTVS